MPASETTVKVQRTPLVAVGFPQVKVHGPSHEAAHGGAPGVQVHSGVGTAEQLQVPNPPSQ